MADDGAAHQLRVSKRFFEAAVWAAGRHAAHQRAGATLSTAQVLGTASLVLEDGGTEREAIAAMVLGALRDEEPPVPELRALVGKKTSRLVAACAAVPPGDVDHADTAVLRVLAAHALREAQALREELRRNGSIVLARFAAPPPALLVTWRARADALVARLPGSRLARDVLATVLAIERDVELDVAEAAWRVAHTDAA